MLVIRSSAVFLSRITRQYVQLFIIPVAFTLTGFIGALRVMVFRQNHMAAFRIC